MKGLLLKDFLILKECKQVVLLFLFYIVISFLTNNFSFVSAILIMYTTIFVLTTFSYDAYSKWEKYSLCFPVSRKDLVLSKYLFFLLLLGGAVFVSLTLSVSFLLFINQTAEKELILETIFSMLGIVIYAVFFISVMFPIVFKIGIEKSRTLMMIIMAVPFLLFGFLGYNHILSFEELSEQTFIIFLCILFLLSFCALFASFFLSVRIFVKKDI